ncbi:hypothetical protein [Herbidospora daliensis]|nr:hypothetical protein [Herbidospora daliensis]
MAKIPGFQHDVMVSVYFKDPESGESQFIVEFIDTYRNPWDLLCGTLR